MSANNINFSHLASETPQGLSVLISNLAKKKLLFDIVAIIYDTKAKQHVAYIRSDKDVRKIKTGIL